MARKPTGRPRGRPPGSRQYRDDHLCVEMARLIQTGYAKDARDAARQVAPKADGPAGLDSKATRLRRNYIRREQWFVMQAKAQHAPARSDAADFLESALKFRRFAEQQCRSLRLAEHLLRSPAADLIRDLEERQRQFDKMAAAINRPFG